jgi:succinate dehydrogenase/fumarate reductase flavoprotein subunit
MHDAPQDVLVDAYPEEEFWQDLLKVTGGITNEKLARLVIRESSTCRPWMEKHGVRFQPSLSGTLHVARTNAFFMGGGKALVNAYYRSAENLGIDILYDSPVDDLEIKDGKFIAAKVGDKRYEGHAVVLGCGGCSPGDTGAAPPMPRAAALATSASLISMYKSTASESHRPRRLITWYATPACTSAVAPPCLMLCPE